MILPQFARSAAASLAVSVPAMAQITDVFNNFGPAGTFPIINGIAFEESNGLNRVVGLDGAGNTLTWTTGGATNAWQQIIAAPSGPPASGVLASRPGPGGGTVIAVPTSTSSTLQTWEMTTAAGVSTWTNITGAVGNLLTNGASNTNAPGGMFHPALTSAPDGTVFLFGRGPANTFGQTGWLVALDPPPVNSWRVVTNQSASPPGRAFPGLAVRNGQVVLFGGQSQQGGVLQALGDTWVFDAVNGWSQPATLTTAPTPRWGHGMTLSARDNRVVLTNGRDQNLATFADAWAFDGTDWVQLATAPSPTQPSAGFQGVGKSAYDTAHDEVLTPDLGGDLFSVHSTGFRNYASQALSCRCSNAIAPMGLFATGVPTLGAAYLLNFVHSPGSASGTPGPVLMAFALTEQNPPTPAGFNNCTVGVANVGDILFVPASPMQVTVPVDVNLVGLRVFHQALGFNDNCVSNALEVRIGR